MAKPYSYDFRQKVMQAVELNGLKKGEACELFNPWPLSLSDNFLARQPSLPSLGYNIQTLARVDYPFLVGHLPSGLLLLYLSHKHSP